MAQRTVLFVCPHGAGKSRVAAAWFNGNAPPGWRATTAGVTPQATVSAHAPRLLAGTPVAELLDAEPPRQLSAVPDAHMVVSIDCLAGDIEGAAQSWHLVNTDFNDAMCDELRVRAQALALELGVERADEDLPPHR